MILGNFFLNGDPRNPRVQHCETGCRTGPDGRFDLQVCIDNVTNAAVAVGCVANQLSGLPSKNRWGSKAEHGDEQSAGVMFFNLGPRTLASAFHNWNACDDANNDSDEFRRYIRGKTFRATKSNLGRRLWLAQGIVMFRRRPVRASVTTYTIHG